MSMGMTNLSGCDLGMGWVFVRTARDANIGGLVFRDGFEISVINMAGCGEGSCG